MRDDPSKRHPPARRRKSEAPWRVGFLSVRLWILVAGLIPWASSQASVSVGLYFVEGQDEPIDFLTIPGFPPFNTIQPWQMTGAGSQFVTDGAFQAGTEQAVRAAVIAEVKRKFYSIPTPAGTVLDIEFLAQKLSGAGSVNVLLGRHNLAQTWFGIALNDGGLGANGANNAAVSIDRIAANLQVDFIEFDDALNAVANVVAHEVGHLFSLSHVWAAERPDLGWQAGDPVLANPYDVMATAQSGLPDSGWLENNIFSSVSGTQANGNSSVSQLIEKLGLRWIGDVDLDDDVDNADLATTAASFTGSGAATEVWADGDVNFDGDVDNADIGAVAGATMPTTASPTLADLIYDPSTGNVKLDASKAAGGTITTFQLENADGTFVPANYNSLSGGGFGGGFEDDTAGVIGDSDLTWVGFSGIANLGNILPTGLNLAALDAYLTTALYTGMPGSGQQEFDLVLASGPRLTIARIGTNFDFNWNSQPGKLYDLVSSTDLATPPGSWAVYDPDGPGGIPPYGNLAPSGTGTNTLTGVSSTDSRRFFAVVERE